MSGMTGAQLLDDLKRKGVQFGSREHALQAILEPYKDREIPENMAQIVRKEIIKISSEGSQSSSGIPASVGTTISRDEFDDLVERVSILEEGTGVPYDDTAGSAMKNAVPTFPVPPLPPPPPMPPVPRFGSEEVNTVVTQNVSGANRSSADELRVTAPTVSGGVTADEQKQIDQLLSEIESLKNTSPKQPGV